MAAAPQRFPLPNMPFRRNIHSGCAIGTSISCTAQAYQAREKSFTMQLSSATDIAILVTVPLAKSGRITASARIAGKFTGEMEKPIMVPVETKFTLKLHITSNTIEIYFNNIHMMDFIHLVSPTDIREVAIEGPLIVEEVVFTPPQGALLDPVPSYEQATISGVVPVADLQRLNLGTSSKSPSMGPGPPQPAPVPSPYSVLTPTPAPPQIGLSSSIINQPMPGIPAPAGTIKEASELPQNRSQSNSVSLNPFEQSSSSGKQPIYENTPSYVPTPFQQAQSTSSSSSATPYYVTSPPETPYPSQSSIQPPQPQQFTTQPIQPYQSPPYPTVSQNPMAPYSSTPQAAMAPYPSSSQAPFMTQQNLPGSVPQQPMPQPYGAPQQYPYAAQNPYMNPHQYPQAPVGMQMQSPYSAYQQAPPVHYQPPQATYYSGYAPQYYGNYPVVYGSGCHYRRSSSCCSD